MKVSARVVSSLMVVLWMAIHMPVHAAAEERQPPCACTTVTLAAVDEEYHVVTCEDCGQTVLQAHSFGNWKKQDADCHVCACACGASVTQAHTWDNNEASGDQICTLCSTSFPEKERIFPAGDAEGDGQVTSSDLTFVNTISSGTLPSPTEHQLRAADVNGDGWVDGEDVMFIYAIVMQEN